MITLDRALTRTCLRATRRPSSPAYDFPAVGRRVLGRAAEILDVDPDDVAVEACTVIGMLREIDGVRREMNACSHRSWEKGHHIAAEALSTFADALARALDHGPHRFLPQPQLEGGQ